MRTSAKPAEVTQALVMVMWSRHCIRAHCRPLSDALTSMFYCTLSGTLPGCWGSLSQLTTIRASHTRLSGGWHAEKAASLCVLTRVVNLTVQTLQTTRFVLVHQSLRRHADHMHQLAT
jgi:hypothetical protein